MYRYSVGYMETGDDDDDDDGGGLLFLSACFGSSFDVVLQVMEMGKIERKSKKGIG